MKVILLENIKRIGSIGEIIDVKRGFARNFLLPNKKALPVTPTVLKQVEHRRAKQAEKEADELLITILRHEDHFEVPLGLLKQNCFYEQSLRSLEHTYPQQPLLIRLTQNTILTEKMMGLPV